LKTEGDLEEGCRYVLVEYEPGYGPDPREKEHLAKAVAALAKWAEAKDTLDPMRKGKDMGERASTPRPDASLPREGMGMGKGMGQGKGMDGMGQGMGDDDTLTISMRGRSSSMDLSSLD